MLWREHQDFQVSDFRSRFQSLDTREHLSRFFEEHGGDGKEGDGLEVRRRPWKQKCGSVRLHS